MPKSNKILFLYSRLPDYFLHCIETFCEAYNFRAVVVIKPRDELAPFQFTPGSRISLIPYQKFSDPDIHEELSSPDGYDALYVAGWADNLYNKTAKRFRKQNKPVICGLDNQWYGTLRQQVARFFAQRWLHQHFSHIWAAGPRQVLFAQKLGYPQDRILTGLYSANLALIPTTPEITGKKEFWFAGRLVHEKGIEELASAMRILSAEGVEPTLHLVGKGPLVDRFDGLSHVIRHGFLQPAELQKKTSGGGIFILPSNYEPWGVVVHEFAAAGFPLLLSAEVGAGDQFLQPGKNGWMFPTGNAAKLAALMLEAMHSSPEELIAFGKKSIELSGSISPQTWAQTLHEIILS